MYEILGQGSYREIDCDFPEITFDSPVRGTIDGWRWASNDILLADSIIENPDTGEYESSRVYTYHWKERALSRLDLDSLNLDNLEGIEILGVSQDANYIQIRTGEDTYTLHTPHLIKKSIDPVLGTSSLLSPSLAGNQNRSLAGNQNRSPGSRPSSGNPFPWVWALLILGVMLGVATYLYRRV